MSELRKDPVTGRWVIIATERSQRPTDLEKTRRPFPQTTCPFCPGNEDLTPPEISAVRVQRGAANQPGWVVRVIPNRFPALRVEGSMGRRAVGMYDRMNGIGAHEVIIETPDHDVQLADLDGPEMLHVLQIYRERLCDLRRDRRFRYLLLFKNHGSEAGASLEHAHSQLIATPILPHQIVEELDGAARHYRHKERCVYCDIIDQERQDQRRVVGETECFVVIQPFAARSPFETWILPKRHSSHYDAMNGVEFDDLSRVLGDTLRRVKVALVDPPYNFLIHSGPLQEPELPHFHWHIEVKPKLTHTAGFEWGSGFFINPTAPEEAAKFLREIKLPKKQ